jgi:hypothetical protein
MTKAQLLLALQKFPDHLELQVSLRLDTGDPILPLDHVEMAVDSSPQTVEASSGADSWQQLLVNKLKVTLVGEAQAKPMPQEKRS